MKPIIDKNPKTRVDQNITGKDLDISYAYHESSQPLYNIRVLLKNLETKPELYVNKVRKYIYQIPKLVWYLNIVERSQLGRTIVHGAALRNKQTGDGIIITAWADVGTSTNALLLANQGYEIIGDDHVDLSADGTLYQLQNSANIYPHPENLKYLKLTNREKILAWIKRHFAKISFFDPILNPNLKVSYNRIGDTAQSAKLKRVYILERGNEITITPIDFETALNKTLATSARLWNLEGFIRNIVHKYCFANSLSVTFLDERARNILTQAFHNKQIMLVTGRVPLDFNKLILANEANQSSHE